MGQSMDKPRVRQRSYKTAQRSLQRTTRSSVCLDQEGKIDTRRWAKGITQNQPITPEKIDKISQDRTSTLNGYDQQHYPIKISRSLGSLKHQLIGDESIYSPNFKQFPQEQDEYGLKPYKQHIQSKPTQKSHGQSHHQITISFSKTKNQNSNHLQEETLISKENLFKILEDQEDSKCQPKTQVKDGSTELCNIIKQINQKRDDTKEENLKKMEGSNRKSTKNGKESSQTSINISKRQEQAINQFNDYDCSDFKPQLNGQKKQKRKLRLSKNLMEVKDKLISVALTTDLGHEMLKTLSLQSISMRSHSRNGIHTEKQVKQFISLNQQDKIQTVKRQIKKSDICEQKLLQSGKKFQPESEKKRKQERPSKVLVFTDSDSYFQNVQEIDKYRKKTSILESNRSNMPTQTSSLKNSGKLEKLDKKKVYLPTAGEEYDLLGILSSHKLKSPKLFSSAKEKQSHTKQEPNPKFLTSSSPLTACKQFEQRNPIIANPSTKRLLPIFSDQQKRHRSSQSKRYLHSKLLIF